MTKKANDFTFFENKGQLVLIADKGFEKKASILKEIRNRLELDEIKAVSISLSPEAGNILSALYSIRKEIIEQELEDATIFTHRRARFSQRIGKDNIRRIQTPVYSLSSDYNLFQLTFHSIKSKVEAFDTECAEIISVLKLDKPKEVKITCKRALNESWDAFMKRAHHLSHFFKTAIQQIYEIDSLQVFAIQRHNEKTLIRHSVRDKDEFGNKEKYFVDVPMIMPQKKSRKYASGLTVVGTNRPLSRYQLKQQALAAVNQKNE